MNTWILTIGNSDIKLTTDDNWLFLSDTIYEQLYGNNFEPIQVENRDLWTLPARVLGLAYGQNFPEYYPDLSFPLLEAFISLLRAKHIKLDNIIILLTEQSELFKDSDRYFTKCPYWKDTCTLEPIITKYLQDQFPRTKFQSLILTPSSGSPGLDSWDSTLDLVAAKITELNYQGTIYVSHQAGTPALSSALQFLTLSKFGNKVKFLVNNEYQENQAELVDSSRYLRGLKIQQAKSLITNSPGGALKLLNGIDNINPEIISRLEYFVDFFNLNRSLDNQDEFSLEAASQRIVDALDLIGIFFTQKNYLQGISLLAATQETFLKVGIILRTQNISVNGKKGSHYLKWDNSGLVLTNYDYTQVNQILKALGSPIKIQEDKDFKKVNQNSAMLPWLQKLESKFHPWKLLEWSCNYRREREEDLRNQLMHNLRGVEAQEVINYLLGYPNPEIEDKREVAIVYNESVKVPFLTAINLFKLPFTQEKLSKELEKLAASLD